MFMNGAFRVRGCLVRNLQRYPCPDPRAISAEQPMPTQQNPNAPQGRKPSPQRQPTQDGGAQPPSPVREDQRRSQRRRIPDSD